MFVDVVGQQQHLKHGYVGLLRAFGDMLNRLVRPSFLGGTPRKYKLVMMKPTKPELEEMADLIRQEKLKPIVDEVFKFEEAVPKAYERQKSGR